MRVGSQRGLPAEIGDAQRVGQRDIVERIGAGAGDRAGHVGDAIMDDSVDDIGRLRVGGGMAGLEAAALIDGDIDQHRSGLHRAEHGAGDEVRGGGSGDEHRADDEVRLRDTFGEIGLVGEAGLGARFEVDAEPFEHFGIAVEDGDIRAEAHRHLRGIEADDTAADDAHLAGRDAGDAAEQHAAPAMRLFQRGGPGLNAHAAGDLAHRFEQRQAALTAGDGFIGDTDDAGFQQIGGLFGIGGEVEIGVEDLARTQHGAFDRLWFLDLDHHFGGGEDGRGIADDLGGGSAVMIVTGTDALPCTALDQHTMAVRGQFARAFGRQTDAIFVVLDLAGAADDHARLS